MLPERRNFLKKSGLWFGFFVSFAFLFWFLVLPFSLKQVVRSKTGCELIFRSCALKGKTLILKDVLLFDLVRERSVRIPEARIRCKSFSKMQISLLQPHFSVSDGINLFEMRKVPSRKRVSIEVVDGTYEWGKRDLFRGRFSYSPSKGLVVDGDGGLLTVSEVGEEKILCSFTKWNTVQFLKQEFCSQFSGVVSGDLLVSAKGFLGSLRCENFSASFGEKRVGASSLEWIGADYDRGKIAVHHGFFSYGGAHFEELTGGCSYNRLLGVFWKFSNSDLVCEGSLDGESGEWRSDLSGSSLAFESEGIHAQCDGFALFLKGKRWNSDELSSSFSFFGMKGRLGLISFSDAQLEGQIERGVFSAAPLKGFLNGVPMEGHVEGSFLSPQACLRLSGAAQHLKCEGSLHVQVDLFREELDVQSRLSQLSLYGEEGEISFSELKDAKASFENGIWKVELGRGSGDCLVRGKRIPFEGTFSLVGSSLSYVGKTWFDQIEAKGCWSFLLEQEIPFSFLAEYLEGDLQVLSAKGRLSGKEFLLNGSLMEDPALWRWKLQGEVSSVEWKSLSQGAATISADSKNGLTECKNLTGMVDFGTFRFPLRGVELVRHEDRWTFDFRIEDRWCDLFRVKGEVYREEGLLMLAFDPEASRLLDIPIAIRECVAFPDGTLESARLSFQVPWTTLLILAPQVAPLHEIAFTGSSLIDVALDLHREEAGWEFSQTMGDLFVSGVLKKNENCWTIGRGVMRKGEELFFAFSGNLDSSFANFSIEQVSLALSNVFSSVEGKVEGNGTLEWRGGDSFEADFLLKPSFCKRGPWVFENHGEVQLHCSRQGIQLQGIDFKLCEEAASCFYGRVGALQLDFAEKRWNFEKTSLHAPAGSLQNLLRLIPEGSPFSFFLTMLSPNFDFDFSVNFDFALDGSSFSCSMSEGLIPLFGKERQLKNVEFLWNGKRLIGSFELRHLESLFCGGVNLEIKPYPQGRIFLDSLNIVWEMNPKSGLIIHSMDGSCYGLEASFYREADQKSLLGSLRCQFDQCGDFFTAEVAKIIRSLKMGKGYELKGRLIYENGPIFNGVLSGKECEILGFQISTLFTRVELDSEQLCFSEMHISDSAGVLNIDRLTIGKQAVSMPSLSLRDFRPSLLQKVGKKENTIAPFVIRDLKLNDFRGDPRDLKSLTAQGELTFINSFKQGRTVLDLPADILGRIVGLDLELLIPVQGTLKLELKERRFWMSDLQESWSEGKRSKFFLVEEGFSPSIDLDGNLNILVKMKQYVLFKITENFLLSIGGTLHNPDYHLQKKRKSLG